MTTTRLSSVLVLLMVVMMIIAGCAPEADLDGVEAAPDTTEAKPDETGGLDTDQDSDSSDVMGPLLTGGSIPRDEPSVLSVTQPVQGLERLIGAGPYGIVDLDDDVLMRLDGGPGYTPDGGYGDDDEGWEADSNAVYADRFVLLFNEFDPESASVVATGGDRFMQVQVVDVHEEVELGTVRLTLEDGQAVEDVLDAAVSDDGRWLWVVGESSVGEVVVVRADLTSGQTRIVTTAGCTCREIAASLQDGDAVLIGDRVGGVDESVDVIGRWGQDDVVWSLEGTRVSQFSFDSRDRAPSAAVGDGSVRPVAYLEQGETRLIVDIDGGTSAQPDDGLDGTRLASADGRWFVNSFGLVSVDGQAVNLDDDSEILWVDDDGVALLAALAATGTGVDLVALDIEAAEELWRLPFPAPFISDGIDIEQAAVGRDGRIVVAVDLDDRGVGWFVAG